MVTIRSLAAIAALTLIVPAARLHAAPQWSFLGQGVRSAPYASPAYNEGYQRGVRSGEEDGRRGRSFNFTDESDYRRADTGYRSQYGNRDRYRDQFRVGFEQGYREGYGRYGNDRRYGSDRRYVPAPGNYGGYNNGGYNQVSNVAFENGYADGYDEGLNDGRARHRDDPIAESRYRSGDHGFNSRYGSREIYRNNYRQGFLQGYERGYRDGRSYR
jgi:flagellar biosynthesis/type III secretory pathway protein FliH